MRRGATHRIAICGREKYCRLCALRIIDLEVSLPIRGKARFSVSVWNKMNIFDQNAARLDVTGAAVNTADMVWIFSLFRYMQVASY